jgi:hypothetical protein
MISSREWTTIRCSSSSIAGDHHRLLHCSTAPLVIHTYVQLAIVARQRSCLSIGAVTVLLLIQE